MGSMSNGNVLSDAKISVQTVPGRSCAACTLCCKLLSITELNKPRWKWCEKCEIGKGCLIYDDRPAECRDFYCGYLLDPNLGDEWFPAHAKMVVAFEGHANRLSIFVDEGRPDAWRKEPYYSTIKQMALWGIESQGQVLVWQGRNAIIVFPNSEKALGFVTDKQFILVSVTKEKGRVAYDAFIAEPDDPRVVEMLANRQAAEAGR